MGSPLIVVGQFVCLNDPQSYVGWSLVLLVGPPMPKRSKGRDETKSDPLVLQVGGWAQCLRPGSVKTLTVTETRSVDNETTLTWGVAAGAAMTLLGQSQPEAQRPIGPIVARPHATDDHRLLEREEHGGDNTGGARS